jgi:uncharacterized protein
VASYLAPGVFVEELPSGSRPITPVGSSTAAFVGVARKGPVNRAMLITNFSDFEATFGEPYRIIKGTQEHYLHYAVRHFFAQGGSRCYVVRIVHYTNIEVAASVQATAAARSFDGTAPNGAAVAPALTVSASSPGLWASQEIEARISSSSKFAIRLIADNQLNATATELALQPDDQVQVGSLLWITDEVIGRVVATDANSRAVTFSLASPLSRGGALYADAGGMSSGVTVYSPGLGYVGRTAQASAIPITSGVPNPANGIVLNTLLKADGSLLRPGDVLVFAIVERRLVVDRVSRQANATVVGFASLALPALAAASCRVYARDFRLTVRSRGAVVEVHENLSLVNSNRSDHVAVRLGSTTAASRYITVTDGSGNNDLTFVDDSDYLALQGGDDGLSGIAESDYIGSQALKTGLESLTAVTDAQILVIPNAAEAVARAAIAYCERRRDMFLILEQPSTSKDIKAYRPRLSSKYAALYHPWISVSDAFTGRPVTVPPGGAVAGIYALTDGRRGVHKAPAGLDTGKVTVADGLELTISKGEYDGLYPLGINAILAMPDGIHVWGSRTISADPDWLQVSIRRLFIQLEKSIENGTQWVTFEPNEPTLWKSIERNVGAFLRGLWLDGRLVGETEKDAFFVRCNAETNPPEVVDAGQVVTLIGAAPSRPAEFVIFRIKQKVGQIAA